MLYTEIAAVEIKFVEPKFSSKKRRLSVSGPVTSATTSDKRVFWWSSLVLCSPIGGDEIGASIFLLRPHAPHTDASSPSPSCSVRTDWRRMIDE